MDAELLQSTDWFQSLVADVERELRRLNCLNEDRRPGIEHEIQQRESQVQGWRLSLGNPDLDNSVRQLIEVDLKSALLKIEELKSSLSEMNICDESVKRLVDPQVVADRLDRLGGVLASKNASLGHLELSMHVDRIDGYPDGRVVLRTCRLGALADAVDLFNDLGRKPPNLEGDAAEDGKRVKPRRRAKLKIDDWEPARGNLNAMRHWAANPNRFADLDECWFCEHEFQVPERTSWAADHAEDVFRRRQEANLSLAKLATEFEVSRPTIGAAIDAYLAKHPDEKDEVDLPRGGARPKKFNVEEFAAEARRLWEGGWSKLKLAEKYGCSTPVVDKALAHAYEQEGFPVPTRASRYEERVRQSRELLDQGHSLDEISKTMGVSDVTARSYLRKSFKAEGKPMPDLRRRERRE